MPNIGIPEIVIALVVIGVALWVERRFAIATNRFVRYGLMFGLAALIAAYAYNVTTAVFRPVN